LEDDKNQKLIYSLTHPILNFPIFVLISNESDLLEKLAFAKQPVVETDQISKHTGKLE
jgi:hypothetical protein